MNPLDMDHRLQEKQTEPPTGLRLAFGQVRIGPQLFPLYWKILGLSVGLTLAAFVVYALATGEPIGARWSLYDVLLQAGIVTAIFAAVDAHQRRLLRPRNLLDRYLQAVARHLPREQRADIVGELSENLVERIEESEAELGRPLAAAEEEALLKRHGHPLLVAGRYLADQRSVAFGRQLIGPTLFPFYARVLRLNLGITLAACLVAAAIVELASSQPILPALPVLLLPFLVQFVIVTLVFAGVEIYLARFPDRWTPRNLPLRPAEGPASPLAAGAPRATGSIAPWAAGSGAPRVSRLESLAQLVFSVLFALWWLAVPRYLPAIFPPGKSFLRPGPAWWAFYQPVLWLAIAGMVQPAVNLLVPAWARFRAAARGLTTLLFMLVLALTLRAGDWVVLASRGGEPAAHRQAVAAVNLWCRVGVVCALAGCAVVLLLDCRRLLRLRPGPGE